MSTIAYAGDPFRCWERLTFGLCGRGGELPAALASGIDRRHTTRVPSDHGVRHEYEMRAFGSRHQARQPPSVGSIPMWSRIHVIECDLG